MRTIEDIEAQIPEEQPDIHDEDAQFQNGLRAGFKAAIGLIERGKSTAEILAFTQVEESEHKSVGDDYADAYQSGRTTALYWVAEQYDWDGEGNPLFREGNIWGQTND